MKKAALVLDDERLLRAAASKSLREFVRQAFNIVVPAEPFMSSWHTDSICDHLEAVRRREIRNLLITMPPRHLKSTIVSVLFPPWCWLHDPTERFLTASYAADLATRDAVASRTLIGRPKGARPKVRSMMCVCPQCGYRPTREHRKALRRAWRKAHKSE